MNWDSILHMVHAVRLPVDIFDRSGLEACRFRPLFNVLVTLYFLHNVSTDHDFTADFAHPIDGSLATFLQSRAAIESMVIGGAISRTNASIETSLDGSAASSLLAESVSERAS